jgi:hypothetical protein
MFNEQDLNQLQARGITPETVEGQLARFRSGFPYLKLHGSAAIGAGISRLSVAQEALAVERWHRYLANGGEVMKFVPASGAASRMFKALFSFVSGDEEVAKAGTPVADLLANLEKLPFINELNETTKRIHGKDAKTLLGEGRQKDIISAIIGKDGMNYGGLPKALLTFHKYENGQTRTPLEEHLMEGAQTAATNGRVKLHFTVSADHRELFAKKIAEAVPGMEARTGLKYEITMSEQKPSTDTVAATLDNGLFRDDEGHLVFRPGGHGALIANLSDIDSAVVFIKNIDNVVPDSRREPTIKYKEIIAGTLILAQDKIATWLDMLNVGAYTDKDLDEMTDFMRNTLFTDAPELSYSSAEKRAAFIRSKFNRPLRVCGMVKNDGEPGGGPFIAYNRDGSTSPQILESTQIDTSNEKYIEMMKNATHFNPVDLVCYIKDKDAQRFNLPNYVDADTGFISSKSFSGRELRALELPGLWNGAMSDWSTIFVEVPAETFNPVKTVNDLLRPAHQS